MRRNHLQPNLKARLAFRIIGFCALGGAALIGVIGVLLITKFNINQGGFLIMLALIMLFVGSVCLGYGFMGAMARYTSSEMAPVAKDTINYMVDGTKESVAGLVHEIQGKKTMYCPNCGDKNDTDARFCDNCGQELERKCPKCGLVNNQDAKFCKSCGQKL